MAIDMHEKILWWAIFSGWRVWGRIGVVERRRCC